MSQQINLFNPIFLKQKKVFGAVPMLESLALILVGTVALTWYASYKVGQLERNAGAGKVALAGRETMLTKAVAQFAPRPKSPVIAADIAEAEARLASLHEVESVLRSGAVGDRTGYAEYFRAFARQNVSGLWLTGLTIEGAGNGIGLQGKAMQPTLIPNYIARLTSEKVMHGRTFASLQIARPADVPVTGAGPQAAPAGGAGTAAGAAAGTGAGAGSGSGIGAGPALSPYVEFSLQSAMPEAAK
ncbi:MSHA biogenesis protein MshA [Rugamonas apoptosis]|uniref:MSHA biogenesis protein MshA n=1 Tax=Rugamonas apoptosis TaxID=2758570 RepID=A0A7W2F9L9_9BURK|nr:MSHA biogenesis protein MshA [Rugamonas apoptosis]MBA5687534.1 MSHA biogenesis protein MshA [Rugamonas apoptosis]